MSGGPGHARRARLMASGAICRIADISFGGLFTLCTCGVTVTGKTVDDMGSRYAEHRQAAKAARRAAAQAATAAHGRDSRPVSAADPDVGMVAPLAAGRA